MDKHEVQVFSNEKFGFVRSIMVNDEPYFVGKDVAEILGYGNTRDAIATHVDEEDKIVVQKSEIPTLEIPNRGLTIINESGLYSLIFSSKLSTAKIFRRWITSEVLPTIRRTGGYVENDELFIDTYLPYVDENVKTLFKTTLATVRLQNQKIKEMKPKAEFFDAVTDSKDAIEMKDVAKVLDLGIGRNKLFDFLRNKKVLMRDNTPYQQYVDLGYFRVIEQKYDKGWGEIGINIKTLVFQKGVDFIRKLWINNGEGR